MQQYIRIIAACLALGGAVEAFAEPSAQPSPWTTSTYSDAATYRRARQYGENNLYGEGAARALAPAPSGHAGFGPVHLNRIEEGWDDQPDTGRAVQVQYPLDPDPYAEVERRFPPPGSGSPGMVPSPAFPPMPVDEPPVTIKELLGDVTWVIGGDEADALGITTFDVRAKFDFRDAPFLTVIPRFGWHLVDGPQVTDLPSQLYDASVEAIFSFPVREGVFLQAAVAPSIFTDGDNTTSDSLRLPARLMAFWNCTDELTLSVGVLFLDREDVDWLPSAGLIYRPNPDVKFELLVPRPKIALRTWTDGSDERWVYIVGEFGGGSWAIQRATGLNDVATYSDYRAMLGWEHVSKEGIGVRVEGGYVFNRELEYVSNIGSTDLPGTGVVRIGLAY